MSSILAAQAIQAFVFSLPMAAVFALAWFYTRSKVVLLATGLWAAFPFYNYRVLAHCSGDCNIRIDLLVVGPILVFISAIAAFLVVLIAWRRDGHSSS